MIFSYSMYFEFKSAQLINIGIIHTRLIVTSNKPTYKNTGSVLIILAKIKIKAIIWNNITEIQKVK